MRALGEMAIEQPVAGSFSKYAYDYIGPLAGYITGWNYWFLWVVTCMAEITAAGIYMQYWFPDIPRWTWALLALLLMSAFNFLSVKVFGELEFWFALIKIVTIICMIVVGAGIIFIRIRKRWYRYWYFKSLVTWWLVPKWIFWVTTLHADGTIRLFRR